MARSFAGYQDWSEEFTKARKEVGNIDLAYKGRPPGSAGEAAKV